MQFGLRFYFYIKLLPEGGPAGRTALFFSRIPVPFSLGWSKMRPMNRRTFIGTSIAASLAAAAKPAWAADTAHSAGRSMAAHSAGRFAAAHSIDRVGLQLYTVRGAMQTDFEGDRKSVV